MTATTIVETPEYFYSSVLPVVQNSFASDHKWADGVLYRDESPSDVIYGDLDQKTGFVLFIHQKWNERDFRQLNLIAIAYRHDVHSLRDLVPDHVDWLQDMRNQVVNILPEIYGIKMNNMEPVLYVPYPPGKYHFHFLIREKSCPILQEELRSGRALLLDHVINQLQQGVFYRDVTLKFEVNQ